MDLVFGTYILETEGIMNKVIDRYPEQKYLRYINKTAKMRVSI